MHVDVKIRQKKKKKTPGIVSDKRYRFVFHKSAEDMEDVPINITGMKQDKYAQIMYITRQKWKKSSIPNPTNDLYPSKCKIRPGSVRQDG